MPQAPEKLNTFQALMQIVTDLRGPHGCPWDKEQTHSTLAPYALEETHEFLEAIETQNDSAIKDELGDVLFQVALHSVVAQQRGAFNESDVLQNICEKLVRRHPHVFANTQVSGIEDVWQNWEKIKAQEKSLKKSAHTQSPFDFPQTLPALQRAHKIGLKTQKMGFDWEQAKDVFNKVNEEIGELTDEIAEWDGIAGSSSHQKMTEEMGDLLFAVAQWSRHLQIEPEQALRQANRKFESRFNAMTALAKDENKDWSQLSTSEKESLWSRIKIKLGAQSE